MEGRGFIERIQAHGPETGSNGSTQTKLLANHRFDPEAVSEMVRIAEDALEEIDAEDECRDALERIARQRRADGRYQPAALVAILEACSQAGAGGPGARSSAGNR
jgi:hypothetical protein